MKISLKFFALLLGLAFHLGAYGQDKIIESYKVELSKPNEMGVLFVDLHNGTISVEGYEGKEVEVSFVEKKEEGQGDNWDWNWNGDHSKKKSKEGLKKISNSYINMEIEEDNNIVIVKGSHNRRSDLRIKVPQKFTLKLKTHHNGDVEVKNVVGELEITTHHGGINMEKVGGSVIADTHHGEIVASLVSVVPNVPMAFSTYHGDVDITFPAGINCDTKIKTARGDIYTDFELALKTKMENNVSDNGRKKIKIGGWMYGKIGSGGEEFLFNTHHGDVVIRKL